MSSNRLLPDVGRYDRALSPPLRQKFFLVYEYSFILTFISEQNSNEHFVQIFSLFLKSPDEQ